MKKSLMSETEKIFFRLMKYNYSVGKYYNSKMKIYFDFIVK